METPNATDEDLIYLTYAMIKDPFLLDSMLDILSSQIINDAEQSDSDTEPPSDLSAHSIRHFQRAATLLPEDKAISRSHTSYQEMIDRNSQPAFLIDTQRNILVTNNPAIESLGIEQDKKIPLSKLKETDRVLFTQMMDRLNDTAHTPPSTHSIMRLHRNETAPLIRMVVTPVRLIDNRKALLLTAIEMVWSEQVGAEFIKKFGLTNSELEITKGIISGLSLNEIADERDRSIETVRRQFKLLQRKLGVHSQIELVRLYSGFSQLVMTDMQDIISDRRMIDRTPESTPFLLQQEDGRQIEYHINGPTNGTPVLFFHGLFGGTNVSRHLMAALIAYNIRLISIARPGFANTSPLASSQNTPITNTKDVEAILDELQIDKCAAIGYISGAIHAAAAAQQMPNRITHLYNVAGNIPFTDEVYTNMNHVRKWGARLALRFPSVLDYLFRVARIYFSKGRGKTLMARQLEGSPADVALLEKVDIARIIHFGSEESYTQGQQAIIQELNLVLSDWSSYLPTSPIFTVYFQGDQDPSFSPKLVEKFCKARNNTNLKIIPNAGQLFFFDQPEIVLSAVAKGK